MRDSRKAFSLMEMLVVIAIIASVMTSLGIIEHQIRNARLAARARLDRMEKLGEAAWRICEDIRRASAVRDSYKGLRTGNDTLVLSLGNDVLVYRRAPQGLVRMRYSADGTAGTRPLFGPGTSVTFRFPESSPERRWVEVTIESERDRKSASPPYTLFAGLRGRT